MSNKAKKITETESQNTAPVLIEILAAEQGGLGLITLNSEKTLNSLTIDMVKSISVTLSDWEQNDDISVIVLSGKGKKAFCAGGDIQALYASATQPEDGQCKQAEAFFLEEYQLNYKIHSYSKPIICIGNGYVMGGGLGLMAGASHRVVTESTKLAMPEVSIGLFPDVCGTYFLNHIPYNIGLFFALTGMAMNAKDAIFAKLANYAMASDSASSLIDNLSTQSWNEDAEKNHLLVDELLKKLAIDEQLLPASNIQANQSILEQACQHSSLGEIVQGILDFDEDNAWLTKAKQALIAGSPFSLLMIYEQLRRHRYADLQSIFNSELILATNMVRYPEFSEGVRALIIDKDKEPKWAFDHFSQIPCSLIEAMFSAPWTENPLTNKFD